MHCHRDKLGLENAVLLTQTTQFAATGYSATIVVQYEQHGDRTEQPPLGDAHGQLLYLNACLGVALVRLTESELVQRRASEAAVVLFFLLVRGEAVDTNDPGFLAV